MTPSTPLDLCTRLSLEAFECCSTPPAAAANPAALAPAASWIPARVPGTVLGALHAAGRFQVESPPALHEQDHWFRTSFAGPPSGRSFLRFDGLATLAEVWLNGQRILESDAMFVGHRIEVTAALQAHNELCIAFRALGPKLREKRPRPRWKTRMIEPATLRFVRTTVLGHMKGWSPPFAQVGPYRPVVLETWPDAVAQRIDTHTHLDGNDGVVEFAVELDARSAPQVSASVGGVQSPLQVTHLGAAAWRATGSVRIPNVERWWPHTHGAQPLFPVSLTVDGRPLPLGRTGFRSLEADLTAGRPVRLNDVDVFCRGAVFSPVDLVNLAPPPSTLRERLELAKTAGMNMLRVGGTFLYESDEFFSLCDELGILVWHDFQFANFDYPNDPAFLAAVEKEAEFFMRRTRLSPSLTVACGGSEVHQQAAMFGQTAAVTQNAIFDAVLPDAVKRARPEVAYVKNSPIGGAVPFQTDVGVTHYYGVGAYLRPFDDVRRADVKFASECLAFSNVPDARNLRAFLSPDDKPVHHPKWKTRVPRDVGATWDFEDVRDHYLALLHRVDPAILRTSDLDRYLELSRVVTGEVMAHVFSEWRRAGSHCHGGLVWLLSDLWAGAGWGLIDSDGRPKAPWHFLRRALQPTALLLVDEGLNGLRADVVNETATPLELTLDVSAWQHGKTKVMHGEKALVVPARSTTSFLLNEVCGVFFDWTYAYRFGPASHDVTVARLLADGRALAETIHLPLGYVRTPESASHVKAHLVTDPLGYAVHLESDAFLQSIHFDLEEFIAHDEWFDLAPNTPRRVLLKRTGGSAAPDGELRALNLDGPIRLRVTT